MKSLFIVTILVNISLASLGQQSQAQHQIWEQELAYWTAVQKGDISTYISLYHPEHLSWPSFVKQPESQQTIEPMLYKFIDTVKEGSTVYDLGTPAIMIQGDLAFVYYLANWSMETTEGVKLDFSEKFLHIWKKEKSGWLLQGGMSAFQTNG